ncbi:MAG: BON domain-containing protein [Desulfococcaceae bacterium]
MSSGTIRTCLITAIFLSGCAGIFSDPAPDQAELTVQVKAAVIRAIPGDAPAIHVEVKDGTVHLRGFVETEAVKREAEEAARSVEGADRVVNEIQLK